MQTRLASATESVANVVTGYVIALLVFHLIATPFFDVKTTMSVSAGITAIQAVSSFIRSYLWRRYFNKRTIRCNTQT